MTRLIRRTPILTTIEAARSNAQAMNLPIAFYAIIAALFGLTIGSFLNVVIHRLPDGHSVVFPGSHCPHCGAGIRPIDNIPLISFAALRGRCRDCHARISFVYPVVELLTALMYVALVLEHGPSWETVLQIIFASAVITLIFIDCQHQVLPNVITYPLFIYALAAATARAGWGERAAISLDLFFFVPGWQSEFSASRAALIGGLLIALAAPGLRLFDWLDGIFFGKYFEWEELDEETGAAEIERELAIERRSNRVIRATIVVGVLLAAAWAVMVTGFSHPQTHNEAYRGLLLASLGALIGGGTIWWLRTVYFFIRGAEGMGLGDVKMMAGVGAFLGSQRAFGVLLIASILGAVVGAFLAFRDGGGLKTPLPFGVCLGIATLVVMLT